MSNKKKILIIGAGYFQLPIVKKAAKKYDVVIAAPSVGEAFKPYVSATCLADVRDKETILKFAKEQKIDGVITDQTDLPVRTIAYVAEQMGLPGIGYETGKLFTDKDLMRKRLKELGIPVLPHKKVFSKEEAVAFFEEMNGPVIIKPLDNQGSRGLSFGRTKEEVERGYEGAYKFSSEGEGAVVEKLATGREFIVEGMSLNGEFKNLCIGDTEYFTSMEVFAAVRRVFPSNAPADIYKRVGELNEKIIKGFGLKQGISHSEFIMDGDEIYLIETAARGGGVFISSDLISLSSGLNTEEFLLDIALGNIDKFPEVIWEKECCGYRAFFIPVGKVTKIEGVKEIRSLPYIHSNQLDELYEGLEIKESHTDKTSRLAVIISAPDRATWHEREKQLQDMLKVEVETSEGIKGLIWE